MLTVLCWFWAQPGVRDSYSANHVNLWASMVRRHLSMPHRIACVTDIPEGIDSSIEIIVPPRDFESARIPSWGDHRPQCLRRISMFRPDAAQIFGERFICMDLDCVVSGPLDPLFAGEEDFKIFRGTAASRRYNGSMMMIRAGSRPQVFTQFSVEAATLAGQKYIGSDQAWISHILPGQPTWGEEHGVMFWGDIGKASKPLTRVMFFPGTPKPWALVEQGLDPWVVEHYRGEKTGRCLILGYAPTVWEDAERAFDEGHYDFVIASPEAAKHWPGHHIIAGDDRQAERLAAMLGYRDTTFCGRSEVKA